MFCAADTARNLEVMRRMWDGVIAGAVMICRESSSLPTRRWREQDSNYRSPVRRAAVLSLTPSPAEAVVVVAEVMVPAEIAAQIARLRSPTADGALPSLRWKVE